LTTTKRHVSVGGERIPGGLLGLAGYLGGNASPLVYSELQIFLRCVEFTDKRSEVDIQALSGDPRLVTWETMVGASSTEVASVKTTS